MNPDDSHAGGSPPHSEPCTISLITPHAPGAVAALQLSGNVEPLLKHLTGRADWEIGKLMLTSIAGVDDGLVVRLRDDVAILMPHGGVRIVHQIAEAAVARGAQLAPLEVFDPRYRYPEAADAYEALLLEALARAESPLAIDLLLDQPRRWRAAQEITEAVVARSQRLNRLITPPLVVLAGLPNVGKSTLTNALAGRALSITANMPGTTRDYTTGRINIANIVVDWHDTPGIRASKDAIESRSIEITHRLLDRADLIIAMAAPPDYRWPDLPRPADLHVINKSDLEAGTHVASGATKSPSERDVIRISALTGDNIQQLARAIREALVPGADLRDPGPWLFDLRLTSIMRDYHATTQSLRKLPHSTA